jgi:hypothetical protein
MALTRLPNGLSLWPKELPLGGAAYLDPIKTARSLYQFNSISSTPQIASAVTSATAVVTQPSSWGYQATTSAGTASLGQFSGTGVGYLTLTTGTTAADILQTYQVNVTPTAWFADHNLISTRDLYFAASIYANNAVAKTNGLVGFVAEPVNLADWITTPTKSGIYVYTSNGTGGIIFNGANNVASVSLGTWTFVTATHYDVQVFYEAKTSHVYAAYRSRSLSGTTWTESAWVNLTGATLTTAQKAGMTGNSTAVGPVVMGSQLGGTTACKISTQYMMLAQPRVGMSW